MRKELTASGMLARPVTAAVCLVLPITLGGISALVSGNIPQAYFFMNKPEYFPPSFVFYFIWTILYVCMGVALYLVFISNPSRKEARRAGLFFTLQMGMNFVWPVLFFGNSLYVFSFFWTIGLAFCVGVTMVMFYRINRAAGILMVPYLGWTIFAVFLNYIIYVMSITPMPIPR